VTHEIRTQWAHSLPTSSVCQRSPKSRMSTEVGKGERDAAFPIPRSPFPKLDFSSILLYGMALTQPLCCRTCFGLDNNGLARRTWRRSRPRRMNGHNASAGWVGGDGGVRAESECGRRFWRKQILGLCVCCFVFARALTMPGTSYATMLTRTRLHLNTPHSISNGQKHILGICGTAAHPLVGIPFKGQGTRPTQSDVEVGTHPTVAVAQRLFLSLLPALSRVSRVFAQGSEYSKRG
jgi:hypothetical protein